MDPERVKRIDERRKYLKRVEAKCYPIVHKLVNVYPIPAGSTAHGLIHEEGDVDGAVLL